MAAEVVVAKRTPVHRHLLHVLDVAAIGRDPPPKRAVSLLAKIWYFPSASSSCTNHIDGGGHTRHVLLEDGGGKIQAVAVAAARLDDHVPKHVQRVKTFKGWRAVHVADNIARIFRILERIPVSSI